MGNAPVHIAHCLNKIQFFHILAHCNGCRSIILGFGLLHQCIRRIYPQQLLHRSCIRVLRRIQTGFNNQFFDLVNGNLNMGLIGRHSIEQQLIEFG